MQTRKILVPTELTKVSDIATKYAVGLARQLNVKEVILLNIIIPANVQTTAKTGGFINTSFGIAQQLNRTMMEKHKEVVEKHAKEHSTPEVEVKPIARINSSKSELNQFMEEFGADIIVAGSQDKFSFLEILFGSDTEKMIRKIDYPMIILTGEPVSSKVRNIALAIDVEVDFEELEGIDVVIDFASTLNAHMQLVYVVINGKGSSTDAPILFIYCSLQKPLSDFFIKLLNGISQHGSRHVAIVLYQEIIFHFIITISNLAQHPAYGLMDQVVRVVQKDFGQSQGIIILPVSDKMHGGDHGNAL